MPAIQPRPTPRFEDLRAARRREDTVAFGQVADELPWEHLSAEQLAEAVNLGLDLMMLQVPRELAALGVKLHPENEAIQRLHSLLKPGEVVMVPGTITPEQQRDREWLYTHSDEHLGQWLALRDGELLASGATYEELVKNAGGSLEAATTRTRIPGPLKW